LSRIAGSVIAVIVRAADEPGHVLHVPVGGRALCRSAACDERDHHVRRVTVEVLPGTAVDGGRTGIGVTSKDLHIAQRHSRVEGRHDEPGAQMKKALILRMLLK
jgi:hypothetical protein